MRMIQGKSIFINWLIILVVRKIITALISKSLIILWLLIGRIVSNWLTHTVIMIILIWEIISTLLILFTNVSRILSRVYLLSLFLRVFPNSIKLVLNLSAIKWVLIKYISLMLDVLCVSVFIMLPWSVICSLCWETFKVKISSI